jgi:hypothetical protein
MKAYYVAAAPFFGFVPSFFHPQLRRRISRFQRVIRRAYFLYS